MSRGSASALSPPARSGPTPAGSRGYPPKAQDALTAGADAAGSRYMDNLAEAVETSLATMEAEGATITQAPGALRRAWAEGMGNAAAQ